MTDDIEMVTVCCPRCQSTQFAIEEPLYTSSNSIFVICRNCNWGIGAITHPNLTPPPIDKEES